MSEQNTVNNGKQTLTVIDRIFKSYRTSEQCINPSMSVLKLSKKYSSERLEIACEFALEHVSVPRYSHFKAILAAGQDMKTRIIRNRKTNCHHPDLCVVLPITEVTIMLSEETRRKLREMNFGELVEALELQENQPEYLAFSFDDRMNLTVDYTYSAKYNAKVHRLISAAKFRIADATLGNVYYEKRGLDKDLLLTLGNCGFIEKNQPVVFNGFTGSGKSYLACAIGRQACMQGYRTRYIHVPDLMQLLGET